MRKVFNLCKGFLDGIRPTKIVNISEWADKNRYLVSESSAEPGPYRTIRAPYLKEPMDNMSPHSPVIETDIMKGVQMGFTDAALNVFGAYADISPCPIMYVMPTIELSKAISKDRVDPMIENCPALKGKVKDKRERDSGNTQQVKKFRGGMLVLSGANSAASLRSRPVRVLILDEPDAYPLNVDGEGSPISLAEKRTTTFGAKKKIMKLSTPTVEGLSVIEKEYLKTDQRKYFVPCPHCGEQQHLIFEQMKWEAGFPETVRYKCQHCNELIHERFKTKMLEAGEWIPTKNENVKTSRRGYHINSLYSPLGWLSWADIIQQYESASTDENEMITFVNTILAKTYKASGDAPDYMAIYNKRQLYKTNTIPRDVVFLTCGVDVQKDRIELEIVGWCRRKISYSVDYRVLLGQTQEQGVWNKLTQVMNEMWTREDGAQMPLRMTCIDSGYNTSYVYDYCNKFQNGRVIACKGKDNQATIIAPPRPVNYSIVGKKIGKARLWHVGVSLLKSELYGWLKLNKVDGEEVPDGFCNFPQYEPDYFKALTSERMVAKIVRGQTTLVWEKTQRTNEALDCRNYARAAASVVGIDRFNENNWKQMESTNFGKSSTKKEPKKRGGFLGGGSFWDKR